MFNFFKKKPNQPEEIKISLFNYPEKKTLDQVIKTVDETDRAVNVKIICTLTHETLAERKAGKWSVDWDESGLVANTAYNLAQFQLA
jgi:hypothetical protein